jgi:uncharacterized protein (DUF2225 family)
MENNSSMKINNKSNKENVCPNCSTAFYVKGIQLTYCLPYAMETDYREYYRLHDYLPYEITNCPKCFYCSYNFENVEISSKLKKILLKQEHVYHLPTSEINPSTKYYIRGMILKNTQTTKYDIGWEFLKASWMARREVDSKLEIFYQQAAIAEFIDYLRSSPTSNLLYDKALYLLGELYRRIKEFDLSYKCFKNLKENKCYKSVINQLVLFLDSKFSGIAFFPNKEMETSELIELYNDFAFVEDSKSILINKSSNYNVVHNYSIA